MDPVAFVRCAITVLSFCIFAVFLAVLVKTAIVLAMIRIEWKVDCWINSRDVRHLNNNLLTLYLSFIILVWGLLEWGLKVGRKL